MSLSTHIDVAGLSVEAAMAKIARELDRVRAIDVARFELCLIRDGICREEIVLRVADYREEFSTWCEERLVELRAWLEADGRVLH
jgi:hypothetical protein